MTGTKGVLASKGVWGGIITIVASAMMVFFNVEVSETEVSALAGEAVDAVEAVQNRDWANLVAPIAGLIGGILAIYGRVTATATIVS